MDRHRTHTPHRVEPDTLTARIHILIHLRNRHMMGADLAALLVLPAIAYLLRTESVESLILDFNAVLMYTLVFTALKLGVFYAAGLYKEIWVYAGVPELLVLLGAAGAAAVMEICSYFIIISPLGIMPYGFPRSIPFVSSLLTACSIIGLRVGIKVLYRILIMRRQAPALKPVLIAGAGEAGLMVARELQANLQLGLDPRGFVDDDQQKAGRRMSGLPVFGSLDEIPDVVAHHAIQEVIIAMPAVDGSVVRRVTHLCQQASVPTKIIPGLYSIIGGASRVTATRDVQLEDLLRRGCVQTDVRNVREMIAGSRVMITGAGGSIGSEIARQVLTFHPSELVLLGHGENSIFELVKQLGDNGRDGTRVRTTVADIRDEDRMEEVFGAYRPEVVFHAAAHKHVWLMEQNLPDAISNNIHGTRTLVRMADRFEVRRFVMVSSDKAVNPTSVMGVTKRIAELIVQDTARHSGKAFAAVRFGNVLGSRGSVVPIFKAQIETGGPVCVSHPDVTRYFMTIPEAVQLVLQAGTMGKGGEVFVLDMGEQLKVIDLARDLIRLSGFTEKEIGIAITGLKPGEKMYEELFYPDDIVTPTDHAKILVSRSGPSAGHEGAGDAPGDILPYESSLRTNVDALVEIAKEGDILLIEELLARIVPQYTPARYFDPKESRNHEEHPSASAV